MRAKRGILIFSLLLMAALLAGCRSQDNFGQRKASKHCNTCTKWSK